MMFTGSGRGIQTADGCSVELYRALPYMGEMDAVQQFLPARSTVLELGCGTGRLTRVLLAGGLLPTCVDNSADMLALLPGKVRAVQADIENLDLSETFDIVLLASFLINHPDEQVRRAFIRCALRHASGQTRVLVQRHDCDWLRNVVAGFESSVGDLVVRVEDVHREAHTVAMTLAYTFAGEVWRQQFSTLPLDEGQVEKLLAEEGLRVIEHAGPRRTWAVAARIENRLRSSEKNSLSRHDPRS